MAVLGSGLHSSKEVTCGSDQRAASIEAKAAWGS